MKWVLLTTLTPLKALYSKIWLSHAHLHYTEDNHVKFNRSRSFRS